MLKAKLKFSAKRLKVPAFSLQPLAFARSAFTLVEVLVVMVLLSLIVFALLAVFNSTQKAFRGSVTQAGVLEGGRATMDLIAGDLRTMAPSDDYYTRVVNGLVITNYGAVNFYFAVTASGSPPSPLVQPMVGGDSRRTNVLENFFMLSRGNQNGVPTWFGVGYAVATNVPSSGPLYSLYRFYAQTNINADPRALFNAYLTALPTLPELATNSTGSPDWSHVMDGVVDLTVRPYDPNGYWMTNTFQYDGSQWVTNQNTWFMSPYPPYSWGEVGVEMFSNAVPASVQIEMGVLEDQALQHAEAIDGSLFAQTNYLAGAAGKVHLFRQRVSIPNVDPSAYQ